MVFIILDNKQTCSFLQKEDTEKSKRDREGEERGGRGRGENEIICIQGTFVTKSKFVYIV